MFTWLSIRTEALFSGRQLHTLYPKTVRVAETQMEPVPKRVLGTVSKSPEEAKKATLLQR